MAAETGTGRQYASAMGELWTSLTHTLARLDTAAAQPALLDDVDAPAALRRLQYALHLASEQAYGIQPPHVDAAAHAELARALAAARDATSAVAEAADELGAEGVVPLLHQWRGALFRVRLARMRLAGQSEAASEDVQGEPITQPLLAFLLALAGAIAFVAGATLGLWPVWVLGTLAVLASVVWYRP